MSHLNSTQDAASSRIKLVHRCLLDAIGYADDLVSGSKDGFKVDGICEAMAIIAADGEPVFDRCSRSYPIENEPFEYDGIAGASWHEVASEWIHRLLSHIAAMTDRNVISAPNEDGTFRVQLIPPILNVLELTEIRICYTSPRRLEAKLHAELSRLMDEDANGLDLEMRTAVQGWLALPRKLGGPTARQEKLVSYLLEHNGRAKHADISTACGFDYENPRDGFQKLVKRVRESIVDSQTWDISAEDRGDVVIFERLKNVP